MSSSLRLASSTLLSSTHGPLASAKADAHVHVSPTLLTTELCPSRLWIFLSHRWFLCVLSFVVFVADPRWPVLSCLEWWSGKFDPESQIYLALQVFAIISTQFLIQNSFQRAMFPEKCWRFHICAGFPLVLENLMLYFQGLKSAWIFDYCLKMLAIVITRFSKQIAISLNRKKIDLVSCGY